MSDKKRLIVLISHGVNDRTQSAHQKQTMHLLVTMKVPHELVDGMDPDQKERRNALFQISDIRGNYPQFFFENEDGSIIFYGKWEKVQDLNET
eukprot:scaffold692990_cov51-Attheya_sp.AAC.1